MGYKVSIEDILDMEDKIDQKTAEFLLERGWDVDEEGSWSQGEGEACRGMSDRDAFFEELLRAGATQGDI